MTNEQVKYQLNNNFLPSDLTGILYNLHDRIVALEQPKKSKVKSDYSKQAHRYRVEYYYDETWCKFKECDDLKVAEYFMKVCLAVHQCPTIFRDLMDGCTSEICCPTLGHISFSSRLRYKE